MVSQSVSYEVMALIETARYVCAWTETVDGLLWYIERRSHIVTERNVCTEYILTSNYLMVLAAAR